MTTIPIHRKIEPGTFSLLEIFPELDQIEALRSVFPDGMREEVLRTCRVRVVPEDTYMYIDEGKGHVVVGLEYLRAGDERTLYLDILHELVHVRQWREGKELWDRRYAYVDRPTEIEAYEVTVREARRLGMREQEIAEYLRVDWVSREEHERLCRRLGVRSLDSEAG